MDLFYLGRDLPRKTTDAPFSDISVSAVVATYDFCLNIYYVLTIFEILLVLFFVSLRDFCPTNYRVFNVIIKNWISSNQVILDTYPHLTILLKLYISLYSVLFISVFTIFVDRLFILHFCFFFVNLYHIIFCIYLVSLDYRQRNFIAQSGISAYVSPEQFKLCFNAFDLYMSLKASSDVAGWSYSILRFLINYFDINEAFKIMDTILTDDSIRTHSLVAQSLSVSDFRTCLNNWKALSESELITKTHTVLLGVLSSTMVKSCNLEFNGCNLRDFISLNKSFKFSTPNEFLYSLCDLILMFVESGYECFTDNSLKPILYRDRAVRSWVEKYEKVTQKCDTIQLQDNTDYPSLLADLNDLISRGSTIKSLHRSEVTVFLKDLINRRSRIVQKCGVSAYRKPPFSVLLYSKPGQGKSVLTNQIAQLYQLTTTSKNFHPDLQWDPLKNLYTLNTRDNFWSGYQGASQWCVLLDDIARTKKSIIASKGSDELEEILTIVNTVGIATAQAALEDKGVIPMLPKLVIATTNTKSLNAGFVMESPAAVARRFPIVVEPILKEAFVDNDGTFKKISFVERDAWLYRVEEVHISKDEHGRDTVRYVNIKEDLTLCSSEELDQYLVRKIIQHEDNALVMEKGLKPDQAALCPHDVLNYHKCSQCDDEVTEFVGEAQAFKFISTFSQLPLSDHFLSCLLSMFNVLPWSTQFFVLRMALRYPHVRRFYTKALLHKLSQAIPRAIPSYKHIMCGAALTLGTVAVVCKIKDMLSSTHSFEAQTNIWQCTRVNELFKKPKSSTANCVEDMYNTLRKSTFRLHSKSDMTTDEQVSTVLCIKPGVFCTVAHPFRIGNQWKCVADYGMEKYHSSSRNGVVLTRDMLYFVPNSDCVIIRCVSFLPRRGVFGQLPDLPDEAGRTGFIYGRMGAEEEIGTFNSHHIGEHKYSTADGSVQIKGRFMSGRRTDRPPMVGDCGSILVAETRTGGCYIYGMHCAGNKTTQLCLSFQLSKSLFQHESNELMVANHKDYLNIGRGTRASGPLQQPHPTKGPHHWSKNSSNIVLGSYEGRTHSSSKVQDTLIQEELVSEFPHVRSFVAPLMQPRWCDDTSSWLNPLTMACEQQSEMVCSIPDSLAILVKNAYYNDTIQEPSWLESDLRCCSTHIAINGIDGDSYINSLCMSTSGGFLFPGQKRKYFIADVNDDKYHMSEDVDKEYQRIVENYMLEDRACVIFNGTLKDEPVTVEKYRAGKTRVFTACDVAFTIVVREQYLRIVAAVMQRNFITECAVSMNCYSLDWDRLARQLARFGNDHIIAGDYSKFDKRMPANMIIAAFNVLDCWRSYYQPLTMRQKQLGIGIATDVAFPITNLNGDVFQFFGGNSSGHPLTVIINSIVNSLYIRISYKELGFDLTSFRDNVVLMTYGDDNIMGSNLDSFNHTSIAKCLAAYGIPYTMADKEAQSVPFISLEHADFLKRRFVLYGERYIAPLSLDSILKGFYAYCETDAISEEERLAECYLSARREWSLHGRYIFDACVLKMDRIFSRHPRILEFYIDKHFYNFDRTLAWVLGEDFKEDSS